MALPDVTVVVPTRNAEDMVEACVASARAEAPAAIILVDGCSTDSTVARARPYVDQVLSDDGGGLPVARLLGAKAATTRYVFLLDSDVVLPPGSLQALRAELQAGKFDALQAGQYSTSGPGYWGRALAEHHRSGRSKGWFGLVATLAERDTIVTYGFDPRFPSGEDIELRWRLRQAGLRAGVSAHTTVEHRYAGDTFAYALGQFTADGQGLGLMVRKHGLRGLRLLALPLAAAVRGGGLSVLRGQPLWLPYYAAYAACNYWAMFRTLLLAPRTAQTHAVD